MSYTFKFKSIGDYTLPTKIEKIEDILEKHFYFNDVEVEAIKELYLKVRNTKSNMTSHRKRKKALESIIVDLYVDKYPELFI